MCLTILGGGRDRGSTVVKVLCYKSEGRCSIPAGVSGLFFEIKYFRSHYGPGVESTSNRNEYQEYFLGVKAAGAYGWQPTTIYAVVTQSGNLNFLETSGPLQTCNGTALPFYMKGEFSCRSWLYTAHHVHYRSCYMLELKKLHFKRYSLTPSD